MSCISSASGCELVTLANVLAVQIGQSLSVDEVSLLAAFFTSLGDNLALIALTKANQVIQEPTKNDTLQS